MNRMTLLEGRVLDELMHLHRRGLHTLYKGRQKRGYLRAGAGF